MTLSIAEQKQHKHIAEQFDAVIKEVNDYEVRKMLNVLRYVFNIAKEIKSPRARILIVTIIGIMITSPEFTEKIETYISTELWKANSEKKEKTWLM